MSLTRTLFLWSRMLRNPLLEMTGETRISSTSGVKTARRLALTRGEAPEPRRRPGELLLLDAGIPVPMGSRPPGGGKFSRTRDLGRCGSPGDRSLLLEVKVVALRRGALRGICGGNVETTHTTMGLLARAYFLITLNCGFYTVSELFI